MTSLVLAPSVARTKRVLVVLYSQSGQLASIVHHMMTPLQEAGIAVHIELLHPEPNYRYPWNFFHFFDTFPESAHMVPPKLAALSLQGNEDFDLIILPYQVWFLTPSLPMLAFLKHPIAARLLAGKPVITVIGCRNMWLMAQEKMKKLLSNLGAHLTDNVALIDKGPFYATFITTPLWLLTGRKGKWFGLPNAGISDDDIRNTRRFGLALRDALANNAEQTGLPLLQGLRAAEADPRTLFSEKAATRSFYLWGKLFRAIGEPGAPMRLALAGVYFVFLAVLLISVVPISMAVQALLRPFMRTKLNTLKNYFEQPSGSGTERLSIYEH